VLRRVIYNASGKPQAGLLEDFTHGRATTALRTFLRLLLLFRGGGQACAQEQAVLGRDAALLAEPRNGAGVVTPLKQGTSGRGNSAKGRVGQPEDRHGRKRVCGRSRSGAGCGSGALQQRQRARSGALLRAIFGR
jgi:hypothetical protein